MAKKKGKRGSITPAQRSARRKNMAIARAAKKSKGYPKTFSKEYKKARKGGLSKTGSVSTAITNTQMRHRLFSGKYSKKLGKLSKVNRKRSFTKATIKFDPAEAAFKKKWYGSRR